MRYPALLLAIIPTVMQAQHVVDVNKTEGANVGPGLFYIVNGVPFNNAKYIRVVEGTAYFSEQWMKGVITLSSNNMTGSIPVKFDILEKQVHYLDGNGKEMIVSAHIKRIVINDTIQNTVFTFLHSSGINADPVEEGYYLLLLEGETSLFKMIRKEIQESTGYGSATTEQKILTTADYFLLQKNQFHKIKKIKDLPDLLSNKRTELLRYIQQNKLLGKSDIEYLMLLEHYQSLQQPKAGN